ncbi:tail fiber assembly protein [Citrobacter portucalensis]|uniref:tail fiber assembly protein n=1 Tax=Citrobacter portucalensis TaxID=1639133 RepID=UPI00226B5F9B|nr:tail fiber assembly protein [Citrobacter portucalensis]MCX8985981.1 tail fiber assembly protein [Citrobacter portucalensis]
MYYSKKIGGFIPDEWMEDGTYDPDSIDAIEITDEEVEQFHGVTIPGKSIDVINGRLAWIDNLSTMPDLVTIATHQKSVLIAEASREIDPLRDALRGGYIDEADKPRLEAWQKYHYELTKVDPNNPAWPSRPVQML